MFCETLQDKSSELAIKCRLYHRRPINRIAVFLIADVNGGRKPASETITQIGMDSAQRAINLLLNKLGRLGAGHVPVFFAILFTSMLGE
ncbi:hypothetical protein M3Y97_00900200 [Aphelenchoides bicaudatus]|nr:hypothetical protein M3Y97_00900200 [Aphelenchoides bicaudatus]